MPFLGEIKRRKVFQVAAVYAVVAWLIIQLGEPSERISRATMAPRLKAAPLTAPTSDSGPYAVRAAAIRVDRRGPVLSRHCR